MKKRFAEDADGVFTSLYEMWARILDREDLGYNEDFFAAGGDSLGAITMLAKVDLRFGSETSRQAADFLDEPTLSQLAILVRTNSPLGLSHNISSDLQIFPVSESGSSQQMFCFPADGEEGPYFRRLATHRHGQIDLSIVRPANTFYDQTLCAFERAGAARSH